MGKASTSKKVARAARTGGGRTRRGSSSFLFPAVMAVVVLLGTLLVVLSRNDLAEADDTPPVAGKDHWHAALGVYVCGNFLPPITDEADPRGIHTHGDGVVHIHPFTDRSGGRNATLGVFLDSVKATVTPDRIDIPGNPEKRNGQKCDGRAATVQTRTWDFDGPADAKGEVFTGNPSELRPEDRQLVTIAFMPEGTEIPRPPSASQLDQLTDVGPAPTGALPPGDETAPPADGQPTGEAPPAGAPGSSDDPTIAPRPETPAPEQPPASPPPAGP